MSLTNIIEVNFGDSTEVVIPKLFEFSYGMMLKFTDLDLPETYQVHFANSKRGASYEQIGTSDGVEILYDVCTSRKPIYAWIYLHPTEDSALTKYECTIPIGERANLPTLTPTPTEYTVIDQAITALNNAVDACEEAVNKISTLQFLINDAGELIYTYDTEGSD